MSDLSLPHVVQQERNLALEAEKKIITNLVYNYSNLSKQDFFIKISADTFVSEVALKIYQAIVMLASINHHDINSIAIMNHLEVIVNKNAKLLKSYSDYLNQLQPLLLNVYDVVAAIKILEIYKIKQSSIKLVEKFQSTPIAVNDLSRTIDSLRAGFDAIFNHPSGEVNYLHSKDVVDAYVDLVNQIGRIDDVSSAYLRSCYSKLDHKIKGFLGGQLIVLAARPGVGKTTLALNFIANNLKLIRVSANALLSKQPAIGLFSLEMSKESILEKMVAIKANIPISVVKRKMEGIVIDLINDEKIAAAWDFIADTNILWADRSSLTIDQIVNMIKIWHDKYDLKLVVIDYLQLINLDYKNPLFANMPTYARVGHISRTLKTLSLDLKIPIVALAQLNRKTEERKSVEKEPVLSDLRESGSIEQDADIVLFLFQESTKKGDDDDEIMFDDHSFKEVVKLKIGKNRHGEVGIIDFMFDKHIGKFST